ncbi:MAG: DUF6209 family protein, partial [Polyangia bacterium]
MKSDVRIAFFAALTCLAGAGCSPTGTAPVAQGAAPLATTSGQDGADRACDVVLRTVSRPPSPTGGGYLTNCLPAGCFFVWEGTIDVSASALAAGATPSVQFQTTSMDPTWYSVPARPVAGATAGTQRFSFRIDDHTVTDGMSTTSLNRTVIQIEPLVTLPDGSRRFDHNRNTEPTANYVLDHDNFWAIGDDASACAPPANATLRFLSGWRQVQAGAIVAGGTLTVDYDLSRLPQCNGSTYQGEPAWGISGYARFSPGGQLVTGPLTQYEVSAAGAVVGKTPWTLSVPADATGVQLWFETSGETCSTYWDSNYGQNYAWPVASAPTAAAVLWAGNWSSMVSRGCMTSDWRDGVAEPLVLDSWALTRATCLYVDAEIWAPGLSDAAAAHPELVAAQVQLSRDGGAPELGWLEYVGRVGNNYRYQWDIRGSGIDFYYTPWDAITYSFRFSTNGNDWLRAGADGGATRTL